MQEMLKKFQDRLTDLTAKNSSLRLLKLQKKNHFDAHNFALQPEKIGVRLSENLNEENGKIILMPCSVFDEKLLAHSRSLMTLKREIDLIEQETGANVFHVAYGFIEGFLIPEFYIRAPLLLYPGKLIRTNVRNAPHWAIEMNEEEPPFFNRTLILAIQRYLGIDISDIGEKIQDAPKEDLLGFVLSYLRERKLDLKLSSTAKQIPFVDIKRADIPAEGKDFVLKPYVVMGKFRQSTSPLLNDYDYLIANPPTDDMISKMLEGKANEKDLEEVEIEELNKVHEKETFFVLDTDASQEAAVIASNNRQGLIVHGPPGTGKSQVIANLVADRLAKGQKVLLVCQKPVALEVVYNRLSSLNLNRHVAMLRDSSKDKAGAYGTISSIFDGLLNPVPSANHEKISEEMHILANKLNEIASSLHKVRPFERTLNQLYAKAIWHEEFIIKVSDFAPKMTYSDLQARLVELKTIFDLMKKYDYARFAWANRKNFSKYNADHHYGLKSALSRLIDASKSASKIQSNEKFEFPPSHIWKHRTLLKSLSDALPLLQNNRTRKDMIRFWENQDDNKDAARFNSIKKLYGAVVTAIQSMEGKPSPVFGLSVEEATKWLSKLDDFLARHKKISRFFSFSWHSLNKEVKNHCKEHGIGCAENELVNRTEQIRSFLSMESLKAQTKSNFFLNDCPDSNDLDDWKKWSAYKKETIQFLDAYLDAAEEFQLWMPPVENKRIADNLTHEDFEKKLERALEIAELTQKMVDCSEYLKSFLQDSETSAIAREIQQGTWKIEKYVEMLQTLEHFDSLCRLDQLKDAADSINAKLIERCKEKLPLEAKETSSEEWLIIVENSFLHAWILQIEETEPHVKDVSTEIYERNRRRYIELLKEKRKAVPGIVNGRIAIKATEVGVTARSQIKREAQKKRRQATLRQIFGAFPEEMLKLIPCWLCTPETVSSVFPMVAGLFDLVIFDEASQCPVENAIPSLYRARQAVVAGDEKQLPPSSYFAVSSEDEEDDDENAEYSEKPEKAKSLLEWSKPFFADVWLTWHYRSKNDALINFSNYAFYGCRMEIAPSAERTEAKPIEFHKVDGKWINNQNRPEAEKIVELVVETLKNDPSNPTVGIITFNAKQTDLINEMFDEAGLKDPEIQHLIEMAKSRKNGDENVGLFVKNIDNVQGDERDVVFFSVAYAKNEEGRMVSNFGPLSQEAGENRLNVAVTRAKKKIHIVCSFDPGEWSRAETYAPGVRLFKRYLEYGKAVSDGDKERVRTILNGLLDGTNVRGGSRDLIFDSPFEEEVYSGLLDLEYNVDTQVGFSGYRVDLGIIHPTNNETYILGVECDGAAFHSSKVARERDYYRQRFLESHGWTIHRIWSRNWWKNRNGELEKVRKAVDSLTAKEPLHN